MKRMDVAGAAGIPACLKGAVDDPREAGARQRPGACRIRNIMTGVDPDRPARATARFRREHGRDRGAGIAVDGRTVRGAVDGAGRQTHVPGASTHGASAPHDFIEEMRLRSKQVRTRELKDTPQSVER